MVLRVTVVVVCALLGALGAIAQNQVILWSGPGQNCLIQGGIARITGPGTFKFQAKAFGMLGVINNIWIDPNAAPMTGHVDVWGVRDPSEVGGNTHRPPHAGVLPGQIEE
jgi:hypothetical protein